jgi:predicted metal-dependent peptidase
MSNHEERIAVARAFAILTAPYYIAAIHGFVFVAVPGCRTMFLTRNLICGYDPEWAVRATDEELAADIIHEVNHFLRRHFERSDTVAYPDLFALAGDLPINSDMRTAGWTLEEGSIYPESFDLPAGLSTEEYYELLLKKKNEEEEEEKKKEKDEQEGGDEEGEGKGGAPGGQNNKTDGDQKGASGKKPQPDPNAKNAGAGSGKPGKGQSTPSKGGGAGGKGTPVDKKCAAGNCGSIAGPSHPLEQATLEQLAASVGRNEVEQRVIEKQVSQAIKTHAATNGRGSVPADLLSKAEMDDEPSTIPWQQELASVLRNTSGRIQSGGDDYSISRPSKRSGLRRGLIRPGLVEHLPEVGIVIDTSGSMGPQQLTAAAREAYAVCQALGIDEVWFCEADAAISQDWKRVGPSFFRDLEIRGGGGTDFAPAIASVDRLNPRPDLLVYCTDGDGHAPKQPPPNLEVVWAVVPSYFNRAPAQWGHTVIISDDLGRRRRELILPDDTKDTP